MAKKINELSEFINSGYGTRLYTKYEILEQFQAGKNVYIFVETDIFFMFKVQFEFATPYNGILRLHIVYIQILRTNLLFCMVNYIMGSHV